MKKKLQRLGFNLLLLGIAFTSLVLMATVVPAVSGYRKFRYHERFFAGIALRWLRVTTAFLSAQGFNVNLNVIVHKP